MNLKFDELDSRMRIFESLNDEYVLPEIYIIARMDGRGFTKITKEICQFEVPFDVKFRNYMTETVLHLMNVGFRVVYGYTESDEISLLLHKDDKTFGRKIRKLTSVFAGEASAKISLLLGHTACFDARVSQLPNIDLVIDYFRWRSEDAHRNALNAHCYWMLRKKGETASKATSFLSKKSVAEKNELLFQNGINFNDVPNWQKRGVGFTFDEVDKESFDPVKNKSIITKRRKITTHIDLPIKEQYKDFLKSIITS